MMERRELFHCMIYAVYLLLTMAASGHTSSRLAQTVIAACKKGALFVVLKSALWIGVMNILTICLWCGLAHHGRGDISAGKSPEGRVSMERYVRG